MAKLYVALVCGSAEIGTPVQHRTLSGYNRQFKKGLLILFERLAAQDPETTALTCVAIQEFARTYIPDTNDRPIVDFFLNPKRFNAGGFAIGYWTGRTPTCPSPYHAVLSCRVEGRRTPPPYIWNSNVQARLNELEAALAEILLIPNAREQAGFKKLQAAIFEQRRLPILEIANTAAHRIEGVLAKHSGAIALARRYMDDLNKLPQTPV